MTLRSVINQSRAIRSLSPEEDEELWSRQDRLERSLRRMGVALILMLVSGLVGTISACYQQRGEEILRVRALIVEDAEGRARIVIGAPVPEFDHRQYAGMPVMTNPRVEEGHMVWDVDADAEIPQMVGVLLLDEDGYERIVLGDPLPDPVVEGKIYRRKPGRHWGLVLNDEDGTERSGYGVWDSGQVSLGLDWRGREAVILYGLPDGRAGINMSSRDGSSSARLTSDEQGSSILVLRGSPASVELRDADDQVTARLPR